MPKTTTKTKAPESTKRLLRDAADFIQAEAAKVPPPTVPPLTGGPLNALAEKYEAKAKDKRYRPLPRAWFRQFAKELRAAMVACPGTELLDVTVRSILLTMGTRVNEKGEKVGLGKIAAYQNDGSKAPNREPFCIVIGVGEHAKRMNRWTRRS